MICPACGYRGLEQGDHRCGRCGRRLDRPPADAPASSAPAGPATAAVALKAEWKQQVSDRLEKFRHKRLRQRGLFPEPEPEDAENSEAVPPPDLDQKVLAFEDFAAERIEPVIIEPPRASARRNPLLPRLAPRAAQSPPRLDPPELTPEEEEPAVPRDILCPFPVAPVALRALAGTLDLAVALIALGIFLGTFHLLGGGFHSNQKALAGFGLAAACLGAFYLFFYIGYGAETPGMQWVGLSVLDFEGRRPAAVERLVRALGTLLSGAAVGLGFLWALADEEALTWHDRMSKTFVTRDPQARRRFDSVEARPQAKQ